MDLDKLLFLDLEVTPNDRIREFGAVMGNEKLHVKKVNAASFQKLADFSSNAIGIVGHNIVNHDLTVLKKIDPRNPLLKLPCIDTLVLSPLCFPENPYHKLVKGYKLEGDQRSHPIYDCKLSASLLRDEMQALAELKRKNEKLIDVYHFLLVSNQQKKNFKNGIELLFSHLDCKASIGLIECKKHIQKILKELACKPALNDFLQSDKLDESLCYLIAWLLVAGFNSILPQWVCKQYPELVTLISSLRESPCKVVTCDYCSQAHSPGKQLDKYFGFKKYRAEPKSEDGGSLQKQIVETGLLNQPLLAILPTGGGKSLCFQIPALANHFRSGALTIVLSPLQALIKDQVDNLRKITGMESSIDAIYGLQTGPEKGAVYERMYLGDTAILYVSPEQLRNKRFADAIARRQIARWVFDEAHCLSKWGHDFRPDYTFAGRFIREMAQAQGVNPPPISCVTATAKNEVKDELLKYFKDELGQSLLVLDGGTKRSNLVYDVKVVNGPEKPAVLVELLQEYLQSKDDGSAVIFCSKRKTTEMLAKYLSHKDWDAVGFHAGLENEQKTQILESFNRGEIQVICATNAFGMGVDKPDIRLVVHHDIPGSLENYIQEAGRAGRDQEKAHCVLLYNPGKDGAGGDIDTQFSMDALGRISKNDVYHILRSIRYRLNKKGKITRARYDFLSVSQILELITTSFDEEYSSTKKTKVTTAISNLESSEYLKRDENQTRVFQGIARVDKMAEAKEIISRCAPSEEINAWIDIYSAFLHMPKKEKPEIEQFAEIPSLADLVKAKKFDATRLVFKILNKMSLASVGLINKDVSYSATLSKGQGEKSSDKLMAKFSDLESSFISLMQEEFPDVVVGESYPLNIRESFSRLFSQGFDWCIPQTLTKILSILRLDGTNLVGGEGSIIPREYGQSQYTIKFQVRLSKLKEISSKRLNVASSILMFLLDKIPKGKQGLSIGVDFTESDLLGAISEDLTLDIHDPHAAIEHGLRYLHEMNIIQLKSGIGLITQAMRIELSQNGAKRRYSEGDYMPLRVHYQERNFQIHVMQEFAKLGGGEISVAIAFLLDYFEMEEKKFIKKYFKNKNNLLKMATSAESYNTIFESLNNRVQQSIVGADPKSNMLVLAGPGSGKTRTVAHRCAYLIKVKRVPAHSILVLCYNRSAAMTLRKRIRSLCENDSIGITICTFHSLALRILGLSAKIAFRGSNGEEGVIGGLENIIPKATDMLTGKKEISGMDHDQILQSLIGHWSHILIDEYQDIDEEQYKFVSAITGRVLKKDEKGLAKKLCILAVGDDDQNIYQFRGANTKFIKQFEEDYNAGIFHLVENYRSTQNIISASNELITHNQDRMKFNDEIRINKLRAKLPKGGKWENLDELGEGLVQVINYGDIFEQPGQVLFEIKRLMELDSSVNWQDFAVLGRTRAQLQPVRSLLEHYEIPFEWVCGSGSNIPLHNLREVQEGISLIEGYKTHNNSEAFTSFEQIDNLFCEYRKNLNSWKNLFLQVLEDWSRDVGSNEFPVENLINFLYDAFFQMKADQRRGDGIFVGTAHSAKGLEFKHVFVLDGDWSKKNMNLEEDRRLFYVTMTRAMENLFLFKAKNSVNPFVDNIKNNQGLYSRSSTGYEAIDRKILDRRYELIGLPDLYLGLGSWHEQVRKNLSEVNISDRVIFESDNDNIWVNTEEGKRIARLSKKAANKWQNRISEIQFASITAIVKRSKTEDDEQFAKNTKFDDWEVPIIDVVI